MAVVELKWVGRKRYEKHMTYATARLNKALSSNLIRAGKLIEAGTIRRMGDGRVLGIVSGETYFGINTISFPPQRRTGGTHVVVVGPSNRKGNLLGIHERGMTVSRRGSTATYPKRETLTPATKENERQVYKLLGRSFRVVK